MSERVPSPLLPLFHAQALEHLVDLAVAVDAHRTVVYASAGAQQWLGLWLRPGVVLEPPTATSEAAPEGTAAWYAVVSVLEALDAAQPPPARAVTCRCSDGVERTLRWRAAAVHAADGARVGAVAVAEALPVAPPVAPDLLASVAAPRWAMLGRIISSMAEGVVVTDAEGRLLLRNDAARRITGHTLPPGHTTTEWVEHYIRSEQGDPIPPAETPLARARRGETVPHAAHTIHHPDGHTVHVAGTARPLYGPDGTIQGAVFIYRDVTEQKRAEEERERLLYELSAGVARLRAVLESIEVGIGVIDGDGRVMMVNRAYRELFGLDAEPVGWSALALRHTLRARFADPEAYDRAAWRADEVPGEIRHAGLTIVSPRRRIVQRAAAPVLDHAGRIIGHVTTYHDITEQRDLDRLKDEFISAAAHELRTPLTVVAGYSQLLQRRLARLAPLALELEERVGFAADHALESAALLGSEVERVIRFVAVLLDISRIQAGRFEIALRPLDIARVVPAVIERLQGTVTSHIITYEGPSRRGLMVLGNEERVQQIIINLVENAVRYSPNGTRIEVRLERVTSGDRRVLLSVRDSGLGLSLEDRERVFQQGYRVPEAAALVPGGMGIGLYMCASIVRQLGGSMWAESDGPGKGSTFSVSLPVLPTGGDGPPGGSL